MVTVSQTKPDTSERKSRAVKLRSLAIKYVPSLADLSPDERALLCLACYIGADLLNPTPSVVERVRLAIRQTRIHDDATQDEASQAMALQALSALTDSDLPAQSDWTESQSKELEKAPQDEPAEPETEPGDTA